MNTRVVSTEFKFVPHETIRRRKIVVFLCKHLEISAKSCCTTWADVVYEIIKKNKIIKLKKTMEVKVYSLKRRTIAR